ncbi:MAG: hypothetical protein HZA79_13125 [Sphingobacteriales bacterium]|nr:hypothetical protein [Sphingobacteriales bacterium]
MKWMNTASFLLFLLAAAACGTNDKAPAASENNIDAARNFIRAALDGKFNEARDYMVQDSLNNNLLDLAERSYKNSPQDTRDGYRASSIRFHQPIVNLNDSTSVIVYSNSYKNDPDTLRVIRVNNEWRVDLKSLYPAMTDPAPLQPSPTDSIK